MNPLLKALRKPKYDDEDLAPLDDAPSFTSRVGGSALSGLAGLGNLLDTPGSMVRDVLGGENPFDQLMAPWSDQNRLSGRQLLRKHGLVGQEDNWGNWAAGFATEIATDPLTFLSGGATKGGQVAAQVGVGAGDDVLRAAAKAAGAGADNWIAKTAGKGAELIGKRKALRTTSTADILEHVALTHPEKAASLHSAYDIAARTADPGITDNALAALKSQPLSSGGIGLKLPFLPPVELLKQNSVLNKISDVADIAHDAAWYGKYSPLRPLTPLFSKAVRGATTKVGQLFGRQADEAARAGTVDARRTIAPALKAFEDSGLFNVDKLVKGGMDLPKANETVAKTVNSLVGYAEGISPLPPDLLPLHPHIDTLVNEVRKSRLEREAIGLPAPALKDLFAEYFPRQKQFFEPGLAQMGRKSGALPTAGAAQTGREEILKDLPGGTAVIQQLSLDPAVSGKAWDHSGVDALVNFQNKNYRAPKDAVENAMAHIAAAYPDALKPTKKMRKLMDEADPLALDALRTQHVQQAGQAASMLKAGSKLADIGDLVDTKALKELAKETMGFDPQHVRTGQPFYKTNMVEGAYKHLENTGEHLAAGHAIQDLYALGVSTNPGDIPLTQALQRAGLTGDNAAGYLISKMEKDPNFAPVIQQLQDDILANATQGTDHMAELVKGLFMPAQHVNEAERLMKSFSAPAEVSGLIEVMDKFQRLFKSSVTSVFPSFHVRNNFSNMFQNWLIDAGDPRHSNPVQRFWRPIADFDTLMQGGVLQDAKDIPFIKAAGITDAAQATEMLRKEVFAQSVLANNLTQDAGDMLAPLAKQVPGLRPENLSIRRPLKSGMQVLSEAIPRSRESATPWNIAGVGTEADKFAPVVAGRHVGDYSEGLHRGAGFIGLLRQGLSPEEAAKRIRAAQVDYGALSDFEKTVMRRVLPFYSFSRGSAGFLFDELSKNPAGRLGKVIRAARLGHNPDELTPDYVAESAAIPLGSSADGTKRFITGFGLPFEDPLSFLGGGLRGASLEGLSRANPLLKAPLEWATGQSFFQKGPEGGRPLEDLDPTLGRILANVTGRERAVTFPGSQAIEALAGNSPVTRLLTTARQLTDKRKGLGARAVNTLTGIRVSDVSPAVQDSLLREAAQKLLKSHPETRTYTRTFVPKDELETMTTVDRAKVEELQGLLNLLSKRASARAKKKKELAKAN